MTEPAPFTQAQVKRAIAAAKKAGLRVIGIRTDGTIIVYDGKGRIEEALRCALGYHPNHDHRRHSQSSAQYKVSPNTTIRLISMGALTIRKNAPPIRPLDVIVFAVAKSISGLISKAAKPYQWLPSFQDRRLACSNLGTLARPS